MSSDICITIARQYGSGGRQIGERLAKLLSVDYYDRELITLAARESNLDEDALTEVDERAGGSLLYTLAVGSSIFTNQSALGYNVPINDKLFIAQCDIIKKLADKGGCVIVGRCADYVLRERKNHIGIFVYSDIAIRAARIAEEHNLTVEAATDVCEKTDKRRANYYSFYTGRKWGRFENYDFAINSSLLGIDGTAELIAEMARKK